MSIEDIYERNGSIGIEVGNTYSYKDLCAAFEEQRKSSNGKKYQLRNWRRYFDWENPTKQKYLITEIFDFPEDRVDGRSGNGGARKGAGRPQEHGEDFLYMLRCFVHLWFNRNVSNGRGSLTEAVFTTFEVADFFGVLPKGFLGCKADVYGELTGRTAIVNKKKVTTDDVEEAFEEVTDKARGMIRPRIIERMEKVEGFKLGRGIIVTNYVPTPDGETKAVKDYRHDLLPAWQSGVERFLEKKGYKSLQAVVLRGEWQMMESFISDTVPDYDRIQLAWRFMAELDEQGRARMDSPLWDEFDLDEYDRARRRYNAWTADNLRDYFTSRLSDPTIHVAIIDALFREEPKRTLDTEWVHRLLEDAQTFDELCSILKISRKELVMHIDWLGVEPGELLRKLRECDYPPSKPNFLAKPKGKAQHYWIELKKQLGGEKRDTFDPIWKYICGLERDDDFRDCTSIDELAD